jgi:tRNA(fMet)-specific endonuclease VapC
MSGSVAVDSNAVIALLNGDANVASLLGSYETVYVPVVVLGELLYGAGASTRVAENRQKVFDFAEKCELLETSARIAEKYAELRLHLRAIGKPIPDNDLWIAASCLCTAVPLITRDGHLTNLPALQVLTW